MQQDILTKEPPKDVNDNLCFHCGEDCIEQVHLDDHVFCCNGCSQVYQILKDNNLESFYTVDPDSRNNTTNNFTKEYAYLKNEDIVQRLISFQTNEIEQIEIHLPQIHCSACIWLLERLHKIHSGIVFSRVDFLKKRVTINYKKGEISLFEVARILHSIGYSPSFNLSDEEDKKNKNSINKKLLYRIAVAGFCFGNVMLISFPEYLSNDYDSLYVFFNYLKVLFAIPVLLYSGWDYIKAGILWFKNRTIGIDLPIAIGMTALFGRSAYEILWGVGEGYFDSFTGFVFLLLIGRWFQEKTYGNISFDRDFKSFFPISIARKNNSEWENVSLSKIQKNDIIRVKHNEIIPCDGKLIDGIAKIDYSFVTGESKLVSHKMDNNIFAGGKVVGGIVDIEVSRAVTNSRLTKLWNHDVFQKEDDFIEKNIIDIIGKYFVMVIIAIATLSFLYWATIDIGKAFHVLTTVLIIACPCVLALSVPFIYGNGIRHLSKFGIHLKNVYTLFRMQSIDHIVFDKTGTLTDVEDVVMEYSGEELDEMQKQKIKTLTYHSNHPLSKKISSHYKKVKLAPIQEYKEIPGRGLEGEIQGSQIRIGSAEFVGLNDSKEMRSSSYVEINGKVIGVFYFSQPIDENIQGLVTDLRNQEYKMSMLTGDNEVNQDLQRIFSADEKQYYHQSPEDKLDQIEKFQSNGDHVMMIGDGLNDSGAFKSSQVGLVLIKDNNQFTPAADVVMNRKRLNELPIIMKHIKGYKNLLYISFGFAILYNGIGLYFAIAGQLTPLVAAILMPISSLTIVLFGFVSSGILTNSLKKKLDL